MVFEYGNGECVENDSVDANNWSTIPDRGSSWASYIFERGHVRATYLAVLPDISVSFDLPFIMKKKYLFCSVFIRERERETQKRKTGIFSFSV